MTLCSLALCPSLFLPVAVPEAKYESIFYFICLFISIKVSPECPGCWTCRAMRMQSISFQDGSMMRPHESKSFGR